MGNYNLLLKNGRKNEANTSIIYFPKETVIMMFYKHTKVIFRSLDGDTDFFDIIVGVLQGLKKAEKQYISETITDAN